MIIGDKDRFAVEIRGEDGGDFSMFGIFLLWCGGTYIGLPDEATMVGTHASQLANFAKSASPVSNELFESDPEHFLDVLWQSLENHCSHRKPRGETFDGFECFVLYRWDEFRFIWRLRREPWMEDRMNDYPDTAFSYTVPGAEFRVTAERTESVIARKLGFGERGSRIEVYKSVIDYDFRSLVDMATRCGFEAAFGEPERMVLEGIHEVVPLTPTLGEFLLTCFPKRFSIRIGSQELSLSPLGTFVQKHDEYRRELSAPNDAAWQEGWVAIGAIGEDPVIVESRNEAVLVARRENSGLNVRELADSIPSFLRALAAYLAVTYLDDDGFRADGGVSREGYDAELSEGLMAIVGKERARVWVELARQ